MEENRFGYHKHHKRHKKHREECPQLFIECVIVCKDYGDFLAWTLPFNRHHFSNMVVVTSPDDRHTLDVCTHYNVQSVTTDAFKEEGSSFNKPAAINVGLSKLHRTGYVIHLDADILLPPRAKEFIERSRPDPSYIYGIDRCDVPSFKDFADSMTRPEVQFVADAFVRANRFKRGSRLVNETGYIPIGFFQLWHPEGSGIYDYSTLHDEYNDHADTTHAERWPRQKRGFIPEIIALHLMSEDDGHGTNWNGRISKPFGID